MKKKNLLIILASVSVIALLGVLAIIFVNPFENNVTPTPKPKPNPTSTSTEPNIEDDVLKLAALAETTQYQEAISLEHSSMYANGDLGATHPVYGVLGAYTVNKYIENGIKNPYFVTNWWGTKDKYTFDSLQEYVSPYLSKDLNKQFKEATVDPTIEAFTTFFNGKIALADPSLELTAECYDKWNTEMCFVIPPRITEMTINGVDEATVKITATVNMQVIYQKPDAALGNLIYQDRDYKLEFVLSKQNAPKTKDTEIPIMIIDELSATLDIKGNTDYIINVAE